MTNFSYLQATQAYKLFATAAAEAERVFSTSPALCAIGCRKALELAVKWVYTADNTMEAPYKDNLQALIHEPSFRFAVDVRTWGKLPVIHQINTDAFWEANDVLLFEWVRKELRSLIQFLTGGKERDPIITNLKDPVLEQKEGIALDPGYDFENYRAKVNRYVNEHGDTLAIYKLTHNIPLSSGDYSELERVLTEELGSREDYAREYGETPFGLLIRKIGKLDHDAAMKAFSAFISDQSLNQKQIEFVHKIINHVEQNGYMENASDLMKPPFDRPVSFTKLFNAQTRTALLSAIERIKENAVAIVA